MDDCRLWQMGSHPSTDLPFRLEPVFFASKQMAPSSILGISPILSILAIVYVVPLVHLPRTPRKRVVPAKMLWRFVVLDPVLGRSCFAFALHLPQRPTPYPANPYPIRKKNTQDASSTRRINGAAEAHRYPKKKDDCRRTMNAGRWTIDDGRWTMDNGGLGFSPTRALTSFWQSFFHKAGTGIVYSSRKSTQVNVHTRIIGSWVRFSLMLCIGPRV